MGVLRKCGEIFEFRLLKLEEIKVRVYVILVCVVDECKMSLEEGKFALEFSRMEWSCVMCKYYNKHRGMLI